MNKNTSIIPFICICVVIIVFILAACFSDYGSMGYYEKKAYEEYLKVCREQNITPQPPFVKNLDVK
jgi:hypothetical protein